MTQMKRRCCRVSEGTTLRMEILDIKNEIEHTKLIISGLKVDIGYSTNKKRASKLKNKMFFMERKLRQLINQKEKLEKERGLILKGGRKEEF